MYEKRKELSDAANKLKNGLFKIDETREKVQTMSGELEEARANVTVFQKQCEEFLVIIVQQKRDADEQQKVSLIQYVYPQIFPHEWKVLYLPQWKNLFIALVLSIISRPACYLYDCSDNT